MNVSVHINICGTGVACSGPHVIRYTSYLETSWSCSLSLTRYRSRTPVKTTADFSLPHVDAMLW